MGTLTYLKDVVTLKLAEDRCIGCGMCLMVCPHSVFRMDAKRAVIENRNACMECGACAGNCPVSALSVSSGVGCAVAVMNSALGRKGNCCCTLETGKNSCC